jgi:hypothetical protein
MNSATLLPALSKQGRIGPAWAPLGPGNRDRREDCPRSHWQASTPDGIPLKLTLGEHLAEATRRHQRMAEALPGLVPPLYFHVVTAEGEAQAQGYVEGTTVARAVGDDPPAPAVLAALREVADLLAATRRASSEEARQQEWQQWTEGLLAAPEWSAPERALLAQQILPQLGTHLTSGPPERGWCHGDLTADNLILSPEGRIVMIDLEDATDSHFFAGDAIQFHVASAMARRHPAFAEAIWPQPAPIWHLYFWLKQWHRELRRNTPAYVAAVRPHRMGLIRRWAEVGLGLDLSGWSTPTLTIHHNNETARWNLGTGPALTLGGWCFIPGSNALRSLAVSDPRSRRAEVAPAPRPDVQTHFKGEAHALHSGYHLDLPLLDADQPHLLLANTGDGVCQPVWRWRPGDVPGRGPALGDYRSWWQQHRPVVDEPRPSGAWPRFSILLPCHRTPPAWLQACLESVISQSWPHWELRVVDDGSAPADPAALVQAYARTDPRIHLTLQATNQGIARSTNTALRHAQGDFIVLLDHDDTLEPGVLAALAAHLQNAPATDVIYTDEDKITLDGRRDLPAFKPAFSPEFFRGVMYLGHLLTVRRSLAEQVGGFDPAYDGLQDYEFMLRVSEQTNRIVHLPMIGYHWRQSAGSIAWDGNSKGRLDELQARAVQAHLNRRGDPRQAVPLGHHRIRLVPNPTSPPAITVIYAPHPTNRAPLRDEVAARLADDGRGRAAEILYPADLSGPPPRGPSRTYPPGSPWPSLVQAASGEVVVWLSITPLALHDGWLTELAALATLPDAGVVAPLLLSREGRVLESGWTWGRAGAGPLMRGFEYPADGYHGTLACSREVAALSGQVGAWSRHHRPPPDGRTGILAWALDLRAKGYPCRIAAAAVVQTPWSWAEKTDLPPPPWPETARDQDDPYYPPALNAPTGDYRLRLSAGAA